MELNYNNLIEKNKAFIQIIKEVIIQNEYEKDILTYNRNNNTEDRLSLMKKLELINNKSDFYHLSINMSSNNQTHNINDYYLIIKNKQNNDNEYMFHFEAKEKKVKIKSIAHKIGTTYDSENRIKITYTPKSTVFDIIKIKHKEIKKVIKVQDNSENEEFNTLNDFYTLTQDFSLTDNLKSSLSIIGTDNEKERFIRNYKDFMIEENEKKKKLNNIVKFVKKHF